MKDGRLITTEWYKSIAFKASVSIVLLVTLTVLLLSLVILDEEKKHTESELLKIGIFITETLARQAALPVLYEDRTALQNLIGVFRSHSPLPSVENIVAYAIIFNRAGGLLAQAGKPEEILEIGELPPNPKTLEKHFIRRIDTEHFEISAPILYQGDYIGLLRVGITEKYRYELLDAVEKKTIFTTAILIIIGILVGLFTARKFIRPLIQLAEYAKKIGDRQWGEIVDINTSDEIGGLAQTFNEMSMKLKNAFEEIQKTHNQLIQAEKFSALGKLSANLAHELKNPLTSIKMIVESATEEEGQVDCTLQDIEIMLYEVQRMESTVNEILSFAGPQKLNRHPNNINDMIQSTISQVRYKLEIAGIQSNVVLNDKIPTSSFDTKRMEQVFVNLVLNAIQAMPDGGTLRVETLWNSSVPEMQILIQDSGKGIDESIWNQIFDPFFTTKNSGTGLGLSIVYATIREHGGRVEFESVPDKGTAFWITLPVEEVVHAPYSDRG